MNNNFLRAGYAAAFLVFGALLGYFVGPAIAVAVAKGMGSPPAHLTQACSDAIRAGTCQNANKCTVSIAVSACGVAPVVDPEILPVCDTAKITWVLARPASGPLSDAKFASESGIAFKSRDGGADEFSKSQVKDKLFEVDDKHSKKNPAGSSGFEYGIHILTTDQPNCITIDPRISDE